jgi:hypothetical protein
MRAFRLRSNLRRAVIDGYALPLGLVPRHVVAPTQGYTVEYAQGEEDEPDTYSFHIVVSHERLAPLLDRLFDLMPEHLYGILEIGSRDAYRSMDVYMAEEPTTRDDFLDGWREFEAFLLEDGSIGAGANSEDPFIEIFLDQWKGVWVHVPLLMRDDVEGVLIDAHLREVTETWPEMDEEAAARALGVRSVLAIEDEFSPDIDEILLQLRHAWGLELNVDPDENVDDSGRDLGRTLWHALVIVESTGQNDEGAYASIWGTAGSLSEMEQLIASAIEQYPQWSFSDLYTIDRIAYDERPEELDALPPRPGEPAVHLIEFEPWTVEEVPQKRPDRPKGPARG